ncbi:MAG: hypothetical protein CSA38_04390 [Flavobacteriales bacterium]|nr:MAG: hypothetical protein CSA38_04390 [Flavobacteriales bacterium]
MKKILLSLIFAVSSVLYGQCKIEGASSAVVGNNVSFSASVMDAQCQDCYQWAVAGANASIISNNKRNEVLVNVPNLGEATLNLTVLTKNGVQRCTKNIQVVKDDKIVVREDKVIVRGDKIIPPCDIVIQDFKEIKYDDQTVAFFPNIRNKNYRYEWTAEYTYGSPKTYDEKVSVFENKPLNTIKKVQLKVTSNRCVKKLVKEYTSNYWEIFNQLK